MQIVIDIPEEKYQGIVNMAEEILDASTFCSPRYLYKAVLNGTPLPKGHGRLIDTEKLLNTFWTYCKQGDFGYHQAEDLLKSAHTIIEPYKAESEVNNEVQ